MDFIVKTGHTDVNIVCGVQRFAPGCIAMGFKPIAMVIISLI